jgi:hypothetical protein
LLKDRDALLTFFDFPAEHWTHLRTSDEIDKRFFAPRAIFSPRGRPRGEERSLGWKLRQVASFVPCRFEAFAHRFLGPLGCH